MILPIAFTALIASMTACSDETDPILTQKDWDGTATYFQSSDEHGFSMYYKPQVGFVGDPMPFYDPVAKDFKVMYLQDYRPNPRSYVPSHFRGGYQRRCYLRISRRTDFLRRA